MRKSPSLSFIAFITSLAVAILSTAFFIIIHFIFLLNTPFEIIISFFVAILFASFILIRYVLKRFIYNKIGIIYKTIGKPLKFEKELKASKDNILRTVERDVAEWAINKNKQIRELRKLEQYRKEFVGNVSHELKTPIFNAQGYIETLLDSDLDDATFIKSYLEKAASNIDRLETIVSDLLEISKFETGRIQLEKTAFDIVKLLKRVMYHYQIMAQEYNVHVKIHANENEYFVFADENRILQVLENLISNGIKYNIDGGKVDIRLYDIDEQYIVEISDSGTGIEEEKLPRIFERFYRADKSRSRKVGGTGLGLSIVKNIIEAHEETINVSSSLGKGTTFSFTLHKFIED
ncbi:MAG: sensor histidine kinase [Sphingobacteriales bacterium]|nr:MAG: sensor histidine kinase [Sphingobacteriales bacterium]